MPDTPPASAEPDLRSAPQSMRIGKFTRTEKLGQGGGGEVWKAWDTHLSRWVALKFLHGGSEDDIARFQREARVAGSLSHPNIAAIFEVVEEAGRPVIVMQYVEGVTLKSLLAAERRDLVRLLRDAALAVEFAHTKGIVHRDLKPENLMVSKGHLFVMDFGLARPLESDISVTGSVVGTPAYMPPEQARGDRVDARSDVYALGATLYEILAGRPPFKAASVLETLRKVQDEDPVAPRRLDSTVDRDLETIAMKALEKDAARRYHSAASFAADLSRWLDHLPIEARPASLPYRVTRWGRRHVRLVVTGALGLLAVAAAIGILLPQTMRAREEAARQFAAKERAQSIALLWGRVSTLMNEAEIYARQGDLKRRDEKLDAAMRLCEERGPSDGYAQYFLGRILYRQDRLDDAVAALTRALQAEPGLAEAALERGLIGVRRYSRSLNRLKQLVEGNPENSFPELKEMRELAGADLRTPLGASAYYNEVDRLYARGELARMARSLADAEALMSEVIEREPAYVWALYSLAQIVSERREYELARRHMDRFIRQHQGSAPAYAARAELHVSLMPADPARQGPSRESAMRDLEAARALGGDMADVDFSHAYLLQSLGEFTKAMELYAKAFERAPEDVGSRLNYANALMMTGRHQEAITHYDKLIAQRPSLAILYINRGSAWQRIGRIDRAIDDFTEAIRRVPTASKAYYNRGNAKSAARDPDGAFDDYTKALEITPGIPQALANRANIRRARGDYAGAIADYDEALRHNNPSPGDVFYNRALVKQDMKRYRDAIADLDEAIKRLPRFAAAYSQRAICRIAVHEHDGAMDDFNRAVELDPREPKHVYNRALLHEGMGHKAKAAEDFQKVLDISPADSPVHRRAEEGLRRNRRE